ncbi:MAG: hypothetical protein G01um101449_76 [Parcubacteria group bacterium Gr01-1014_49]|nr:MAG: hypothetical protein G01um101449_76 [Parcubacteria group bacterium Gr01-1014_49]
MTFAKTSVALIVGLLIVLVLQGEAVAQTTLEDGKIKSVEMNESVLRLGFGSEYFVPPGLISFSSPLLQVWKMHGEYILVIVYLEDAVTPSMVGPIKLNDGKFKFEFPSDWSKSNSAPDPNSHVWEFTLTPKGYLTWENLKE